MELTEDQKYLIRGLKSLGAEGEEVVGIMLALETEDQVADMIEWLRSQGQSGVRPTMSDVIGKMLEIVKE
ncbi:MAG: hypothetical protein IJW16_01385 [Clostridia bacterium]|nr:hypothetical protein [Clostridia bacterium]